MITGISIWLTLACMGLVFADDKRGWVHILWAMTALIIAWWATQ